MLLRSLQHNLGRAKFIPPMDQRNFGCESRQKNCFFHRGIATANSRDVLPREKEAIAGRAGGDPVADERLLTRQSQPARRCSARNNEGPRLDSFFSNFQGEWSTAQVCASDMGQLILGAKPFRLAPHVRDQLGTLNSFRKSWEIFDQRGERKLSTGLVAFEHQGFELCARGVQCRRVSGTARSHNYYISDAHTLVRLQNQNSVAIADY